jgi:hypothetical protein
VPTVSSSLSAGAVVIGPRLRHHRNRDHFGTQDDTTVVLSTTIGPYAAGSTLASVLEDLFSRLVSVSSQETRLGSFTMDVFVLPYFVVRAVKLKTDQSGSFTANARYGLPATRFDAASVVLRSQSGTFTASSYVVP